MEHTLKGVSYYVQKHIEPWVICYNPLFYCALHGTGHFHQYPSGQSPVPKTPPKRVLLATCRKGCPFLWVSTIALSFDVFCCTFYQDQYIFVHNALLQGLVSENTTIPCARMEEIFPALLQTDPVTQQSPLEKQFEVRLRNLPLVTAAQVGTDGWWMYLMTSWCVYAFHPLLALCEGNPPVTGGFPSQRASNLKW